MSEGRPPHDRVGAGRSPGRVLGLLVLLLVAPTSFAHAQSSIWTVRDFTVTFEIRNAGFPVVGSFGVVEAEVDFNPAEPQAGALSARIDPSSIATGIGFRDRHLVGRQYFNVRAYPWISMESVRIASGSEADAFTGVFKLQIRDVIRDVEIPFTFVVRGGAAHVAGTLTIDRREFGIGEDSVILSDDVTIRVDLELSR